MSDALLHSALDALYALPGCSLGGPLHLVTEDMNTETHHIVWCVARAAASFDDYGLLPTAGEQAVDVVMDVACELLAMPEDDREPAIEAWHRKETHDE